MSVGGGGYWSGSDGYWGSWYFNVEVWFGSYFFVNVWFSSDFFVNVWFSSDFLVDVWFSWDFEVKVWFSSWVNLSSIVVWGSNSVTKVSWSGKSTGVSVSSVSKSSWSSNSTSGISQTSGSVVTGLGGGYQTGKYSNKSLHDEYDELQMLFEN